MKIYKICSRCSKIDLRAGGCTATCAILELADLHMNLLSVQIAMSDFADTGLNEETN